MDKRYVNVVGGSRGSVVVTPAGHSRREGADSCFEVVAAELEKAGFGDFLSIVPGPLIRATSRNGTLHTHMPLTPQSTYDALHALLDEAHKLANLESPDPELDLQGLDKPRWGHHSFRRMADTVARQSMSATGASEQDIDLIFGWNERLYSQKMQVHYESKFDREKRKVVTRMV